MVRLVFSPDRGLLVVILTRAASDCHGGGVVDIAATTSAAALGPLLTVSPALCCEAMPRKQPFESERSISCDGPRSLGPGPDTEALAHLFINPDGRAGLDGDGEAVADRLVKRAALLAAEDPER